MMPLDASMAFMSLREHESVRPDITLRRIDATHWSGTGVAKAAGLDFRLELAGRLGSMNAGKWLTSLKAVRIDTGATAYSATFADWKVHEPSGILAAGIIDLRLPEVLIVARLTCLETITQAELNRVLQPPTRDGMDAVRGQIALTKIDTGTADDRIMPAADIGAQQRDEAIRKAREASRSSTWWIAALSGGLALAIVGLVWARRRAM